MTNAEVPAAGPEPGWYADPWLQAPVRWWDGAVWTPHVAGATAPGNTEALEYLLPVNTDGFAIASGYLGLFSLLPNPFTSVAAIACGIVAMQRINRTHKHGRGRAITGLVLGGLSLGICLLAVIVAAAN